jgi:PKD repeat protein
MKKLAGLLCICILLVSCGKKPEANFSWTPQKPKAGEEVNFINTTSNGKTYSWNLGNMKISSEENPKNIYDKEGEYIVDLTAHNGLKSDTKTLTITVVP